jgi:homoserine kinase
MIGSFIKVFAPATVSNLTCGFDILGFPLENIGDELSIKVIQGKRIRIKSIKGFELPFEPDKNVAGVVARKMIDELRLDFSFEFVIKKGIEPGSGIGSSAASAAGVAYGINELLGKPLKLKELVKFAMEGERLASGTLHADNVAPALLGNLILIRSYNPLDIIQLPSPADLFCTLIHPHIQVKTKEAREILEKRIPLDKAVQQWGNVAGLIAGIVLSDYSLISRSMEDVIIEPIRSVLIPRFDEVKKGSLDAGALGCGISGSGPSVFAFSKGKENARKVRKAMIETYHNTKIKFDVYISKISPHGAYVLERSY